MKVELSEERANSERYKKQSQILRLELDHLLQQLSVYVSFCLCMCLSVCLCMSLSVCLVLLSGT